jgi:hypothetical protein
MVKDIYSGTTSSSPDELTRVDDALFFQASDGSHGAEPWVLGVEPGVVHHVYLPVIYRSWSSAHQ